MRPVSRISRWFASVGLIAAAGLIGWVARSTSAHNVTPLASLPPVSRSAEAKSARIPDPPAHEILELAQAPAEPQILQPEPTKQDPAAHPTSLETGVFSPTQLGSTMPEPAGDQELAPADPGNHSSGLLRPPTAADYGNHSLGLSIPPTAAANDDPAKAAQAFAEQNQKVAETQLKDLRDEEAKLRARLQKVEAGIKRWEALVDALNISKTTVNSEAKPSNWRRAAGDPPEVLDAIPKHKIGPPPEATKK